MLYFRNPDGSFSPIAPRINDAAPSDKTTYSGNKVEEIAGLKLDRTDLTISEEIVLHASHWETNKTIDILFPRDLNDTFILIPTSIDDWYKYGIKLYNDANPLSIWLICEIIPDVDITLKIMTIKADTTKDADTNISDITYDATNQTYLCKSESAVYNDFEFTESGIIAISSTTPLTADEANAALDMYAHDITTHSINEPLTISEESGKIWYIRSYVIYHYTDNIPEPTYSFYHYVKYSGIVSVTNGTITEINNTMRQGVCPYIGYMRQDPTTLSKFGTGVYSTIPTNHGLATSYGLIATRDEETANAGLTLNTSPVDGVTYLKTNATASSSARDASYRWTKTNALGQTWWVRPYVTLSDDNTNTTYYGRMESFTMPNA